METIQGLSKHFYPPQRKLQKGYVFTPVILSTGGGVCPSACWDTPSWADTPRGQTPLWADT